MISRGQSLWQLMWVDYKQTVTFYMQIIQYTVSGHRLEYGMAASIKGLVNLLGPLRTIIGLRLFTNNLFIIAKCTYATPDPVQPDQHYLRVHCVYPLCHFTHVPCISPTNFTLLSYLNLLPSYCQCPSPTAELPALTL